MDLNNYTISNGFYLKNARPLNFELFPSLSNDQCGRFDVRQTLE